MNHVTYIIRTRMVSMTGMVLAFSLLLSNNTIAQEATPLEPSKPITRAAKPRQTDTYQLSLTAGQFIRVTVEQNEANVSIDFVGTDDKSLQVNNSTGTFGQESLSREASVSGSYKVIIRTLSTNRSMTSYQIQLELKDVASAQDKKRNSAEQLMAEAQRVGPNALTAEQRLEKCQQVIQLWREVGDKYWEAITLELAAAVYFSSKKYDQEVDSLNQALAINTSLDK